jgi:hypothetical protein
MKIRPDTDLVIHFQRESDGWTTFVVEWKEGVTDGVDSQLVQRSATYQIADLDTTTKQALQAAWDGMKAMRDTIHPL